MRNALKINTTSSVGYLIGISAWSLTFLTLIWGYVFYRLKLGVWLQEYIDAAILTKVIINTSVILGSSVLLHYFKEDRKRVFLLIGLSLGVLFIKFQWDVWSILIAEGLTLQSSIAGSFLYLLTGFHALHILVGISLLLGWGWPLCKTIASFQTYQRFVFALKFWDLLLLFWCVLFILIFILK